MGSTWHGKHTDMRCAPERHKHTINKQTNKQPVTSRETVIPAQSGVASKPGVSTFREAREYGGTRPSYFPEMIPQASGDHVMAPTPEDRAM